MIPSTSWILSMLVSFTLAQGPPPKSVADDGDFNNVNADGSFDFGYNNKDIGGSYHISQANRNNVVRGRFGSRDPSDGKVKETLYTAGPRGFRARGPHIHRRMDLDQRPRGPIGNKDDPYFDPNEDPSFSYGFKTPTFEKQEDQNRRADVTGRYSFVDDIGERHNVEYIAGRDTGFHVKTAYPDSNPGGIGPLFYNGPLVRGEKKQRGHTSIQRGLDGSYKFISAGPDQRRTESSDSHGNVRGSYTYLDDKNVQRTVHYIAGPGIGYRVIKNSKDPFIPSFIPGLPDYRDPNLNKPFPSVEPFIPDTFTDKDDSLDDIFGRPGGSAASGHVKPPPNKPPIISSGEKDTDLFDKGDESIFGSQERPGGRPIISEKPGAGTQEKPGGFGSDSSKPSKRPGSGGPPFDSGERPGSYPGNGDDDDDFFGKPSSFPDSKPPSIGSSESGPPDFPNLEGIKPDTDDDSDIFGGSRPPRPGSRPGGSGSGSRPGSSGRPDSAERPVRPGSFETTDRPDSSFKPFVKPGYRPGGRPGLRPGSRPRPGNRPTSRPFDGPIIRPDSSESGRPKPDLDEDDFFGGQKPGVTSSGEKKGGSYSPNKPGSGHRPNRPGNRPNKPGGGYKPSKPYDTRPGSTRPGSNEIDKDTSREKFKPGDGGVSFVNVDDDEDIFGAGPPGSGSSGKKPSSSGESVYRPGGYGGSGERPSRPGGYGGSGERPSKPGGYGGSGERPSKPGGYGGSGERPSKPGGYGGSGERPSKPGGYGGSVERPSKPGGYGGSEERPSKPGGYGGSGERPSKPGGYGGSEERPSKPGGYGGSEERPSKPGGYGGSGERPSRPGPVSGPSQPDSSITGPDKPVGPPISGSFPTDKDDKKHDGIYPHPGGDTEIKFGGPAEGGLGGTIFTNLGAESIHFPPGKSVRAHVQSIDLIPYGKKVPSPSEAIDKELKKHGSR